MADARPSGMCRCQNDDGQPKRQPSVHCQLEVSKSQFTWPTQAPCQGQRKPEELVIWSSATTQLKPKAAVGVQTQTLEHGGQSHCLRYSTNNVIRMCDDGSIARPDVSAISRVAVRRSRLEWSVWPISLITACGIPHRYRGLLALVISSVLGMLLLVACGDSPRRAQPVADPTPKVQQPALRPRATPPATAVASATRSPETRLLVPVTRIGTPANATSTTEPTPTKESQAARMPTAANPSAPVPTATLEPTRPTIVKPTPSAAPPTPSVMATPSDTQAAPPTQTTQPASEEATSKGMENLSPQAFVQVATGRSHACALQRDGRAHCWGANDEGQLNVPDGLRFQQITTGSGFSCGLRTDSGITCWGRNNHSQADAPEGAYTTVDAGWDHACATGPAGATCWGWNVNERTAAPSAMRFSTIAAGAEHSCALTITGDLVCWGKNDNGRANQLQGPFQDLAVGIAHTCVTKADNKTICQGDNVAGQSSPPDFSFDQISAGADITCGLLQAGIVMCWGGSQWSDMIDAERGILPGTFQSVSVGWNGTCTLTVEGYSQCWSYTLSGALFSPYFPTDPPHTFLQYTLSKPYDSLSLIDAYPGLSLSQPMEVFAWPSGGLAIADRVGHVTLVTAESDPKTIIDLSERVSSDKGEQGLLSVAVDPDFSEHPYLYIYYSVKNANEDNADMSRARLARLEVLDRDTVRIDELTILEVVRPASSVLHYGGAIRFGPDGMLYLGIGDGGCRHHLCAQTRESLHGKIIRIDVRGATVDRPYRVPGDNPFLDEPSARAEIWAYGLRNPWRMSFNLADGSLWVGDVGHAVQEEISIVTRGANLGWPILEGMDCHILPDNENAERRRAFAESPCSALDDSTKPTVAYGRVWGCPGDSTCTQDLDNHPRVAYGDPSRCAVVGGVTYRGSAIHWLKGTYLFGDFCSGEVWALDGSAGEGWRIIRIADLPNPLSSFGVDKDGEVYVLTFGGPLRQLIQNESG